MAAQVHECVLDHIPGTVQALLAKFAGDLRKDVWIGMCAEMCVDMYTDMCGDVRTGMCTDMRTDTHRYL